MTDNPLELCVEIVSSFVSANKVDAAELPALVRSVHQTLSTLGQAPVAAAETP